MPSALFIFPITTTIIFLYNYYCSQQNYNYFRFKPGELHDPSPREDTCSCWNHTWEILHCSLLEIYNKHLKLSVFLSITYCLKSLTVLEFYIAIFNHWVTSTSLALSSIRDLLVLSWDPLSSPPLHCCFSRSDPWFSLTPLLFGTLSCSSLFSVL